MRNFEFTKAYMANRNKKPLSTKQEIVINISNGETFASNKTTSTNMKTQKLPENIKHQKSLHNSSNISRFRPAKSQKGPRLNHKSSRSVGRGYTNNRKSIQNNVFIF